MNKIFNINLGGFPFTIDEDAYHKLNKYLSTIKSHFTDSEGCDEILEDIETRMGELFQEQLKGKAIVSMRELNAAIAIMGTPEEFGAPPIDDEPEAETYKSSESKSHNVYGKRRLFRDVDNKVLGGVASGISAYFGIDNVVWVRLGILMLMVFGGVGFLIYPIMWIVIPSAKTSADKLAMKGEPINVTSIAKKVEEELLDITDRITALSKDLGNKKKIDQHSFSISNQINTALSALGDVVLYFLELVQNVLKPIISLALGFAIFILAICWLALIAVAFTGTSLIDLLGPQSIFLSYAGYISLFLLIAIPLASIMMWITRYFRSYRVGKSYKWGLSALWVASFVIVIMTGISIGHELRKMGFITSEVEYNLHDEPINIQLNSVEKSNDFVDIRFGPFVLSDNKVLFEDFRVNILKSETDKLRLEKIQNSFGKNKANVEQNASQITYHTDYKEGLLLLDDYIGLSKSGKYRGQDLEINIYIPKNKLITIDSQLFRYLDKVYIDNEMSRINATLRGNKTWQMTESGLRSVDNTDQ